MHVSQRFAVPPIKQCVVSDSEHASIGRPIDSANCTCCNLDLRQKRCFDMRINENNGVRNIRGVCCGCLQEYQCGVEPSPSCSESSQDQDTSAINKTFNEDSICASSTPYRDSKLLPLVSPRVVNLQSQAKRNRKRRGSALERLLKEEDSEADRSLSGFLSMVAKH